MFQACVNAHILHIVQVLIVGQQLGVIALQTEQRRVDNSFTSHCFSIHVIFVILYVASQVFTRLFLNNPRGGGGGRREEMVGAASPRKQADRVT